MFPILPFQQQAIGDLKDSFVKLWSNPERQLPLVFKAPTGSGKTFMMTHFINDLNQLPNWDYDKAFIWITFSDDLAMQSRDKFIDYFENTLKNDLLTVSDINNGKLKKNDILFINWQKLVSRATENRVLRRPEEKEFQKESGYYFEDFIEITHNDDREIILVIDEAHTHVSTDLAQRIIDTINPKIVVHVSATPQNEPRVSDITHNRAGFVEVEREQVVEEGLIKEKIVVQSDEDLRQHKGQDLDNVLLDIGFMKRLELKNLFESMGKDVNPLMLIQLPNDDRERVERGEKTKEKIVLDYLTQKGVDVENHVALWFDKYKKNLEFIIDNDSDINFMLFKQAAGTGWDCPRAHVLVMFREISSPTFYIQTVGRILRMAEPDKSEDYKNLPDLRTGYLFTNYKRKEVQVPDQSDTNKPFVNNSQIRKPIHDSVIHFQLQSAYIPRVDYGDLADSAKFQASFLKSFNNYFNITDNDIVEKTSKKLIAKGLSLKPVITNELIVNAEFEDFDQLAFDFAKKGKDVKFDMSVNDIEKTFNYCCYQVLKEQDDEDAKITNIARSWSPFKAALRVWLKRVLESDSNDYYRVFVYDILKGPSSVFRPTITITLKKYRPILNKILKERSKTTEKNKSILFRIREKYEFTEDYEEVPQTRCVLEKCFVRKDYEGKENEKRFIEYIDSKHDEIFWWFKNGDSGKDYYSLKYYNTGEQRYRLFYPDWIIRFSDGRKGIFDTKSGQTLNTEGRAKGLGLKLKELGKDYVGGIVWYKKDGTFQYCDSIEYDDQTPANNEWKPMEGLFV